MKPAVDEALLEEHAEELYEEAPCGYLSILEDGTIVKVNRTLVTWLGYQASELLQGKKFQELMTVGGRIFFETHFAPLIKMQGFANEINFDLICKNREKIPVLTSTSQRRKSETSVVYRITVFNITDRKKYERELILERQRAEKAARAKSDFLSMMSHEIRTPMNAVIGIANLLEQTSLSHQQIEYVSMLKASSENLLNLLNSILDYSKIEAGKVAIEEKNFNLLKLIEDLVRGQTGRAREKNLDLNIHFHPDVPAFVVGDPIKIGQVLTNLVSNAVKFTNQGKVDVSITCRPHTPSSVTIHFEVADTGIGIPPERLSRIFDEFTQADYEIGMKYGGSGLGLTISRKLVELHGSQIQVQSEPGKGSTFAFDLHLQSGKTEATPASLPWKEQSHLLEGVRVLVAEDNSSNLFVLERLLKNWGVHIQAVGNGQEALERIQQQEFDLVLMDLRMPVMDGYQATTLIRQMSDEKIRRIPIIAFSASTKVGEHDLVEITAFNDLLGKPFRPDELFNKIAFYSGRIHKLVLLSNTENEPAVSSSKDRPTAFFELTAYKEIFEEDHQALSEMVQLIIESYHKAVQEFTSALSNKDLSRFDFQSHRIKNSVEMLNAAPLRDCLAEAKNILEKGFPTESISIKLNLVFRYTIEGLIRSMDSSL